jgi:hypothetical protein
VLVVFVLAQRAFVRELRGIDLSGR